MIFRSVMLLGLTGILASAGSAAGVHARPLALPSDPAQAREEVSDEVLAFIERGDELRRAKRYDEAISQYKAAIAKADKPPFTAHLNLGAAYYEKADFRAAADAYRRAIEIKPNDFRGYYNLAEALYALGNYSEAEAEYRKVPALTSQRVILARSNHFLALSLHKQGRNAEAVPLFRTAIDLLGGKYAEAHYNLGTALLELKDYSGAEREFRTTIDQDLAILEARYNLGLALEYQKRFQDAADEYDSFLRLAPAGTDDGKLRAHIQKLRLRK
jgi:tetratricopeptide (TPR) repeat protein